MRLEDYQFEIPEQIVDDKDFDVEKWRLENPVDYLKAIHLIIGFPIKEIAFEEVFKVLKLYVPDTLYKYYSLTDDTCLNEQKLNTLLRGKIYANEAKYLNDPFDNKAYFFNPGELMKYKRLKKHKGRLIDDFSAFSRVSAFTANGVNSMPMWAHYSNNHDGYCVSYNMRNEGNLWLRSCTFPVQYTDQRIDISSLMKWQIGDIEEQYKKQTAVGRKEIILNDLSLVFTATLLINLKHVSWSYENEFRCTIGVSEYTSPYVSALPNEIYIGLNCSKENRKRLLEIGRKRKIPVYQMLYDEMNDDFNLIPKLL